MVLTAAKSPRMTESSIASRLAFVWRVQDDQLAHQTIASKQRLTPGTEERTSSRLMGSVMALGLVDRRGWRQPITGGYLYACSLPKTDDV